MLELWDAARRLPRVESPARREARPFVFYDGPPFATGTPHYGHLLAGTIKDIVPRYWSHARLPRRAPLRLGLPRPADREPGARGARPRTARADIRRLGVAAFNAAVPLDGASATSREWRKHRHAHGALGRLRQRLQDHGPVVHGDGVVGLQAALGQGAASTRRYRIMPYSWKLGDAALELRGEQQLPRTSRIRRSPCASA